MRQVKGKMTCTSRPLHTESGNCLPGLHPHVIVRTKSAWSRRWWNRWLQTCQRHKLKAIELPDGHWDCVVMSQEVLDALHNSACVVSVELCLDTKAPRATSKIAPVHYRKR